MGYLILIAWYVLAIIQLFLVYGTAYRYTKKGGDDGFSLFGWMLAFELASLIPGLGIYLWKTSKEEDNNRQPDMQSTNSHMIQYSNTKSCPFCSKEITDGINFCSNCGSNIREYDNTQKIVKEKEFREKYKDLNGFFNDEGIMREAKEIRRIYGKGTYISHLKNKAMELGLGEIEINEDDIE